MIFVFRHLSQPSHDVTVVACLRSVIFVSLLTLIAACSLELCLLRKWLGFLSKLRETSLWMIQDWYDASWYKLYVWRISWQRRSRTGERERGEGWESGFVWLKARATGMTVGEGWERNRETKELIWKKLPHCSQNCCEWQRRCSVCTGTHSEWPSSSKDRWHVNCASIVASETLPVSCFGHFKAGTLCQIICEITGTHSAWPSLLLPVFS